MRPLDVRGKKKKKKDKLESHPVNCDCPVHANRRVANRVKVWQQHGAAAPVDPAKTVFVPSYWRRQKNHLKKYPRTYELLVAQLRILHRAQGR